MGRAGPYDCRQRTLHAAAVRGSRLDEERARPVAIDAEGLRERDADDAFGETVDDLPGRHAIRLPPLRESEVGEIEPGHHPLRLQPVQQGGDLFGRHVGPGGVVTDALKEEQIPGLRLGKTIQHLFELDLGLRAVVVGHRAPVGACRRRDRP
jgi:hypothetical protein